MEKFPQVISQLTKEREYLLTWVGPVLRLAIMVSTFLISHYSLVSPTAVKSSKAAAEELSYSMADYNKSLSNRIKEGLDVKNFQNE
jgi:hypothetical protein